MPRAFLMQYRKNEEHNVTYQEADTTEDKAPGNQMIDHTTQNNTDTARNDKQEARACGEEAEQECGDVINVLAVNDISDLEDDEEHDEEDIDVDGSSDEDTAYRREFSQHVHENLLPKYERNVGRPSPAGDAWTENSLLERNLSMIGSLHSAFTKPIENSSTDNRNGTLKHISHPQEGFHFLHPSSTPFRNPNIFDQKLSLHNYWHPSIYGGLFPWPASPQHPWHNPGIQNSPLSNVHQEISQRQFIHNQMLLYGRLQANMMGITPQMNMAIPPYQLTRSVPQETVVSDQLKQETPLTEVSMARKYKGKEKYKSPALHHKSQHLLGEKCNRIKTIVHNDDIMNNADTRSFVDAVPFSPTFFQSCSNNLNVRMHNDLTANPRIQTSNQPSCVTPSQPAATATTVTSSVPFSPFSSRRPRDPNRPPPVKKYKCDICPKAFSRSNTLVTHRRIHTGEKPFKCQLCGRAFRQPGNLTRHRLTHTSVKPFVCIVCKKAFNRASNLHTHMRTHSTYKSFHCPCCGKHFNQKTDLKIHMYTHGSGY